MVARAAFDHGGPFPASLLSEGTLRLLALAALKEDAEHAGVLCFEEPENGIHPLKMRGLLHILRGLAADTRGTDDSLRQVIVNTHLPTLVSLVDARELLFARTRRLLAPTLKLPILASDFLPVRDELPLRSPGVRPSYVTRTEVVQYLSSVEPARWGSLAAESAS